MTGEEGETADIDWIRKNLGFVADQHRICVGITRSKFGLVIVGECCYYDTLMTGHIKGYILLACIVTGNEKVLKYDRIWKKLIKHYKDRGCFRKGNEFPR